jgi:hypothetical protein
VVAVAVFLSLPSLWVGWSVDDHFHRVALLGLDPLGVGGAIHPLDIFRFLDGDAELAHRLMDVGALPWWTWPELEASFFRPVTAATHLLDYHLWPDLPALMHLHSVLWFGLAVAMVACLYRVVHDRAAVAALAALLYAVDEAHGFAVGWLANRNALLAVGFGALAITAYIRWSRSDRWRDLVWSLLWLLAGLLSAEAAVAVGAYILAHALVLENRPWRQRALRVVPFVIVGAVWWTLHHRAGYGIRGSGLYIDPTYEPAAFVIALVERAPVLLAAQLAGPSASGHVFVSALTGRLIWWLWAVALLVGGATLVWRELRHEPVARFWALGMLLAAVPVCATFPHDRLLWFVGIGAMGLVAQLLIRLREGGGGWWRRSLMVVLIGLHLVLAPLLLPVAVYFPAVMERAMDNDARVLPDEPSLAEASVVLVNPNIPFLAGYFPTLRWAQGLSVPKHTRLLAPGTGALEIERTGDAVLRVRPARGFLSAPMDVLYRGSGHPMAVGDIVELTGMSVEITATTADRRPGEAVFRFDRSLDDRTLVWLRWVRGAPEPWQPPAVGETVLLEAQSAFEPRRLFEPRRAAAGGR